MGRAGSTGDQFTVVPGLLMGAEGYELMVCGAEAADMILFMVVE